MSESTNRDVAPPPHLRQTFYAPHPNRWTVFLRTFLPWQLIRFAVINLKMIRIIWRSHRSTSD